jgi:hypothetical protein
MHPRGGGLFWYGMNQDARFRAEQAAVAVDATYDPTACGRGFRGVPETPRVPRQPPDNAKRGAPAATSGASATNTPPQNYSPPLLKVGVGWTYRYERTKGSGAERPDGEGPRAATSHPSTWLRSSISGPRAFPESASPSTPLAALGGHPLDASTARSTRRWRPPRASKVRPTPI